MEDTIVFLISKVFNSNNFSISLTCLVIAIPPPYYYILLRHFYFLQPSLWSHQIFKLFFFLDLFSFYAFLCTPPQALKFLLFI